MTRLILGLLLSALLAGATVITNTTCTATGFATVSNPSSCSITVGTGVTTNASVSGGFFAVNITGVSASFPNLQAQAIPPLPALNQPPTQATASANGSISAELATGGPVRPGYIAIAEEVFLSTGLGAPSTDTADITIGSLSTTCSGVGGLVNPPVATCSGTLGALNGGPAFTKLPFTLGEPFLFSADISLLGSLSSTLLGLDGNSSGNGSLLLGFSFSDINNSPVQVYAVPEPKSWALLLAGSFVLAGWSFARLSQKVRRM
ncbi:MAG: hypothetical protein JO051_06145 [Acidobacteriaceae bacterium]|nr:hypothetical protein [Acidobacteriaceae bacterium]